MQLIHCLPGLLALLMVFLLASCQVPHSARQAALSSSDDALLIDFLDVGQGDAVLLRAPGGPTVLIDGGRPGGAADEQLRALGVERLDLLLATHADYDHTGVHERLLEQLEVGVYLHNGLSHTTRSFARITSQLEERVAAQRTRVFAASSFRMGHDLGRDGVGLLLLPPPPSLAKAGEQNQQSIGLVVTRGRFKAVLTGDSEGPELRSWLELPEVRSLVADADVYKAVHHGADNGDPAAPEWLERVGPELIVVPVGDNSYGHPTDGAMGLYRKSGRTVLRTDRSVGVQVQVAPDGRWSHTTGRQGALRHLPSAR